MKICVFGDSVAKGVVYDEEKNRYIFSKNSFVNLFSKYENIEVKNYSKFGLTINRGEAIFEKRLAEIEVGDIVVLEFGGNDCNFNWADISKNPNIEHLPATDINIFKKVYIEMIDEIKEVGGIPIILSLPPLDTNRFFDWISQGLSQKNILGFLGEKEYIYRWHELYNLAITEVATEKKVPLVDIRKTFLSQHKIHDLICKDGMHPSEKGHKLISQAILQIKNNLLGEETDIIKSLNGEDVILSPIV